MLAREFDIEPVVVVTKEHRLAPIATLGNMVRHMRRDRPSKLCLGLNLAEMVRG